uniref:Embryonal Fyn-associated substrate n=1 Tax=Naja naja TaxID=35670 RepID=A0A8C6Y4V0_NAJNA
ELSFHKGDLMVLLQPEGTGLEGWHLCSLHGQQGIVPANRVKVLPESGSHSNHTLAEVYEIPPPARPCPLPPEGIYRNKPKEKMIYDVPSSLLRDVVLDMYDSPAPRVKKVARVAPQPSAPPNADEAYDVPLAFKKALAQEEAEEEEEENCEGPLIYAIPSNLRRASALLNLYESPEDIRAGGRHEEDEDEEGAIYDVPLLTPSTPPLEGALQGLNIRDPGPPTRPRLPSAESLSRRPLPALPSEERLSGELPPPSPNIVRKGSIQDRPLPLPPPRLGGLGVGDQLDQARDDVHNEYEGIRLADEYDYVHLKGADKIQQKATTPEASPTFSVSGEATPTEEMVPPSPEDSQLLQFYTGQCQTHYRTLLSAIEALLASAGAHQPPRVFVPHGKFVIVTAHKLVFVGDTVSPRLCRLKEAVLSVKSAALSYPSLPAAREMQGCVAELSRQALAFTTLLGTLAPS